MHTNSGSNASSPDRTAQHVKHVALKLPPYWPKDPTLWFAQVESQFSIAKITKEETKFHHVVASLSSEAAAEVRDLILKPPDKPYTTLKETLVQRTTESATQRLQKALTATEIGDAKPTQVLRMLQQQLDGMEPPDNMLKQVFLQKLPVTVRSIVAANSDVMDITQIAELADRVNEHLPSSSQSVALATATTSSNTLEDRISRIETMLQRVCTLSTKQNTSRKYSRSRSRGRFNPDGKFCYYHWRYRSTATKCKPPCAWKTPENKKLQAKKRRWEVRHSTASRSPPSSFAVTAILFNKPVRFLIDTGADVSLLPQRYAKNAFPKQLELRAANGTPIKTFGHIPTSIALPELRRDFSCTFVVADTTSAILGADFFQKHKLLIDVARKRISDSETCLRCNLLSVPHMPVKFNLISSINQPLLDVLHKNEAVFDIQAARPKPSIEFSITTIGTPKAAKAYRLSPDKVKAAKGEIEREVELGRMRRSSSHYASPFFPVKKPNGDWRFVADYTALNSVTVKDNYIPPRIEDLLARIPQNSTFSKLDLQEAFFLIPIRPEDQPKTAVATPFGLYEYTVMPMGLKNASQTLQRYIDSVLTGLQNVIAYCDDILLFTPQDQHVQQLDMVLQKLHSAGLVVNQQKSIFSTTTVKFLGHILTETGYKPSEDKLAGIRDFATPTTGRQVRRFLGLVNFYRKFIPRAAELQAPLTALTRKDTPFLWTEDCETAFVSLINAVINATSLNYYSINDEYILSTDASNVAVGAVLSSQNGPCGFFSPQLRGPELNYCTYDKELTAIFKAVSHFEWLLFGRPFTLKVDHKPLTFMFTTQSKSERRRRQIEYLSTFEITIQYLPGRENIVADALSRDKIVDTIVLKQNFSTLSPSEILRHQDEDTDLHAIHPSLKSKISGVWRDSVGRLLVPKSFRNQIIQAVHSLAHAGVQSTLDQIQLSYSWPNIRKDVSSSVQQCADCQQSKITRHVKPPYKTLGEHPKFSAIHMDFVGPLPQNKGKRYLLTFFDRGSRWFSAIPASSCTAEVAADGLVKWVADYGVPEYVITDRGTHFESSLFREITQKLGITKHRTTAYHPISNGAVERQHRRLKEALKAKSENASRTWLKNLPLVLLGLRNAVSQDTGCSAAQAVFGRQLSIPNCVFDEKYDLSQHTLPTRNFERKDAYIPDKLKTCTHVWLRKTTVRSLERPYVGPYKVESRNFDNHTIVLKVLGSCETVSMERVKPAWGIENSHTSSL